MRKMETEAKKTISIENTLHAPIDKVWSLWTDPNHIKNWNNASDDWYTPFAENDLRVGGKFLSRMESKDGKFGFDFRGIFDDVKTKELISYTLDDGRKVTISFSNLNDKTKIVETFEAESTHSIKMQKDGWQSILDNFKKYVESTSV
jgi:uncharacterized protein YndB with AHSA1/START domain